jgi:maltooligosyltrehalose trehalohydrolase
VNFGGTIDQPSLAEPLVAPVQGRGWTLEWSSEDPKYGGAGTGDLWPDGSWQLPAETAVVLMPGSLADFPRATPKRRRTA